MIRHTIDVVVYFLEEEMDSRPDLILMYYPSEYTFYWFIARSLSLLERTNLTDKDMIYAHSRLAPVIRKTITKKVLKQKKKGTKGSFWAEFLGNYANKSRN